MGNIIYVYGLLNPITNLLFYIGITNQIERRLVEHKKSRYNPKKEKIIKEILDSGNDVDVVELDSTKIIWDSQEKQYIHDLLEIKWIKRARDLGIKLTNLTSGGNGFNGEINNKEVYQYNYLGNFINKHKSLTDASEEIGVSVSKISLALNQKVNNSSKGFYWFTSKELAKNFKFKKPFKHNKKIVAYDLNGNLYKIFKSQSEAEKVTGVNSKQINKCLREKSKKKAGDYQWFYYKNDLPKKIFKWVDPNLKPVLQYTKRGKFIKEYLSIKEATEELGLRSNIISCCCTGKCKTANGYVWKYK